MITLVYSQIKSLNSRAKGLNIAQKKSGRPWTQYDPGRNQRGCLESCKYSESAAWWLGKLLDVFRIIVVDMFEMSPQYPVSAVLGHTCIDTLKMLLGGKRAKSHQDLRMAKQKGLGWAG